VPQSRVRNPVSIAGAWLATLGAFGFLTYLTMDWLGLFASPYAGLIGDVLIPAVFVLGLVLIPIGMWREGRRRRLGRAAWVWPVIDLGSSRTRQVVGAIGVLTLVNVAIVSVAGVGVVHYTESNSFCGQVCHEPMKPEFTAHAVSPHANVDCVQCHVGPGAKGFVRAKANGTRQLYEVIAGNYSRPIPSPARGVPMAAETCARCHTAGSPDRDVVRVVHAYADDATNTDSATTLTMHLADIHWHARPETRVEFVSDPKRETIPYVRVTDAKGVVTEYLAEGVTAKPSGEMRLMDCLDCHNRPAHTFSASADRAVNAAMGAGQVDRTLPFAHKELVAALSQDYATDAAAAAGIAEHLQKAFGRKDAAVDGAIATAQRLYSQNVFRDMKVTWGTYQSMTGHTDVAGCFRCHDESHKARSTDAAMNPAAGGRSHPASPRRILVLGATGGTGQHVLAQALQQGHEVTALVRHPERLTLTHDRLRVIAGSVTDDSPVLADAVRGQAAVISTLGAGRSFSSGGLISQSVPRIVRVMEQQGVRRLVFTSAFGVGDTRRDVPLVPRIFIRVLLGDIYRDKASGESALRASSLDWTLVYPSGLSDGPAAGHWRAGERLSLRGFPQIARADVASFLLSQIDDPAYVRKGVLISS
jgi:putative NADH-flavin reductase/nitrate/TMAO reductase-like tetraheme cytochrome c subunit